MKVISKGRVYSYIVVLWLTGGILATAMFPRCDLNLNWIWYERYSIV